MAEIIRLDWARENTLSKSQKKETCHEFGPKEKRGPQLGRPCCGASQGKSVHNLKRGDFGMERKCECVQNGWTFEESTLHSTTPNARVRLQNSSISIKRHKKRIRYGAVEREQHKRYAQCRNMRYAQVRWDDVQSADGRESSHHLGCFVRSLNRSLFFHLGSPVQLRNPFWVTGTRSRAARGQEEGAVGENRHEPFHTGRGKPRTPRSEKRRYCEPKSQLGFAANCNNS
jgi:hypothetical protein